MENHYCVLFTQTLKQWEVTEVIRRSLPEDKGIVFYPCVELWMGSLGRNVIEPLFPGYVFIRSVLSRQELHAFVRSRRREILSFVKELHFSQERAAGEDGMDDELTDLTEEEAELLDFMLGFRYEGVTEGISKNREDDCIEIKAGKTERGKKIYHRKLPKTGVLMMSYGYKDVDDRYVVMEGPLVGHEDRIVDVNPKERRAYLSLKVGGRLARVGLEIRSKRKWFPKDKEAPEVLEDGSEINPKDIAAAMMGYKDKRNKKRNGYELRAKR